jgi:hypothetical protein
MVLFTLYNEDGDEIDTVCFIAEELAEEFDSIAYTWQDLDELGYRLLDEYNNSGTFSWEYLGGEKD